MRQSDSSNRDVSINTRGNASIAAVFPAAAAAPERTLINIFETSVRANPDSPALDDGERPLTYRTLHQQVTALAAQLRAAGIGAGDRVGVRVPSGTAALYVSILAVLAAGAAYVPVDVDDPAERAELIWAEAGVCAVLGAGADLAMRADLRPTGELRAPAPTDDAWIIFTSGSTGKPKGVAITHRSAAAFVDAEAELFLRDAPLGPDDRVLAGLSVAFDASCEEMWLAWRHGACLTPAPRALVRSGADLGPWLVERGVTVVSTVPTLAALWPDETIAQVRLLILGGEACPAELAARLCDGRREVWNTYGPTEATVVACAALLTGQGPVRIGLPLAGWDLAVVDRDGTPVPWGEVGELVIGGVGLGRYLDRAKDAEKYAALPGLGWRRAYRSGDLVRAERAGLVFVGRADDQVKVGGRRIELGEIEAALSALPGVRAAACAVRRTAGGAQVLAGYVVPEEEAAERVDAGSAAEFDTAAARAHLAGKLPAALLPLIIVVPSLPTRTSGKVDRAALPWPPPRARQDTPEAGAAETLPGTAGMLARRWRELLGTPVADEDADFFALGGGSLAAAQLVSTLRRDFPTVSVTDVYQHPTLRALAGKLDQLGGSRVRARRVAPPPRFSGLARMLMLLLTLTLSGARFAIAFGVLSDVARLFHAARWAPYVSWWGLLAGWALLLSLPARVVISALGVRLLRLGIRPGSYRRGGLTHLRLWAAGALGTAFGVPAVSGTHWGVRYARLIGCRFGRNVDLHSTPPVTGLATFGDGCAIEGDVDMSGMWLDGDVLHVGSITVGAGARVGTRSTLLPGADIGENAEVLPGSCVTGYVPVAQCWAGSPAGYVGPAGAGWPRPRHRVSRRWRFVYTCTLMFLGVLPILATLPSLLILGSLVIDENSLGGVALWALISSPLTATIGLLGYAATTIGLVRALARALPPGVHPADGRVGWAAWFAEGLVGSARQLLFPLYASLATPVWLRLLGARVGRRVEASTVLALPHLMRVDDHAFLADDARLAPYELRGGWLRLGVSTVGRKAFVGNSGIVGPDRAVSDGGLIGVLSSAPQHAPAGSSWLGQPPIMLPRTPERGDPARTFDPPRRLVFARACVELCRLVPVVLSGLLALGVLLALDYLTIRLGPLGGALCCGLVLFGAGLVACAVTTIAKWLLVGRCRATEHPLWSSFVWRNELADTFIEELAVPWLGGAALGTPLLNLWLRSLGAKIGRGAWIETYWLPEPDLIEIGAGASVNRGVVVQTHLFHDRIMRLDRVRIGRGGTVGPHSIVLPGSTVEPGATVGAQSLVMRGETVPASTRWAGNPIAASTLAGPPAQRSPRREPREPLGDLAAVEH
jgi:non-ribosomal peptide synthetase-like protein